MTGIVTGKLVLSDGSEFSGVSFGAEKSIAGEVVFNTGMTGYPEAMTDPSYKGQILTLTYPLIGNYGVPKKNEVNGIDQNFESDKIHISALIVSEYSKEFSHWNAKESLGSWLKRENIPALEGIDTRKLTKILREKGAMLGKIIIGKDIDFYDPNVVDLVAEVSIKEPIVYEPLAMRDTSTQTGARMHEPNAAKGMVHDKDEGYNGSEDNGSNEKDKQNIGNQSHNGSKNNGQNHNGHNGKKKNGHKSNAKTPKIIMLDCGMKNNMITELTKRGAVVKRVPYNYDFTKEQYDALFISNGPGDPKMCKDAIKNVKTALQHSKPIFGVCLGNQILALASGANTYKLKYGHRSQNQPCIEVGTKKCIITTQNHGFAVDTKTLSNDWEPYFINANDQTNEGIRHKSKPFRSVQFHPESKPGPVDAQYLFDEFLDMIQ